MVIGGKSSNRGDRLDPCVALSSRVVNLCNALPAEVVESTKETQFKRRQDFYFRLRTTACSQMSNIQDNRGGGGPE